MMQTHAQMLSLAAFNDLPASDMAQALLGCCQCHGWVQRVISQRPFSDVSVLQSAATQAWAQATEAEILEAFQGHPQIGDLQALRNKYQRTATAEQGQVAGADELVLLALQARNEDYRQKFGFIFIICATGKSAAQMLALLLQRLPNTRHMELVNGAQEQLKITLLRLNKLIID